MVWGEKSILRDVAIGSVTVSILSVLPALMIMTTINTVVTYRSSNTLALIVIILLIALGFEMMITWARRTMLIVLGNRLDTRINLAIFERLMTLPLDFFECNRAGEIAYKVSQLYRVREFLTGQLITTFSYRHGCRRCRCCSTWRRRLPGPCWPRPAESRWSSRHSSSRWRR